MWEVKFNINNKENDLSVKRLIVPQLGKLHLYYTKTHTLSNMSSVNKFSIFNSKCWSKYELPPLKKKKKEAKSLQSKQRQS